MAAWTRWIRNSLFPIVSCDADDQEDTEKLPDEAVNVPSKKASETQLDDEGHGGTGSKESQRMALSKQGHNPPENAKDLSTKLGSNKQEDTQKESSEERNEAATTEATEEAPKEESADEQQEPPEEEPAAEEEDEAQQHTETAADGPATGETAETQADKETSKEEQPEEEPTEESEEQEGSEEDGEEEKEEEGSGENEEGTEEEEEEEEPELVDPLEHFTEVCMNSPQCVHEKEVFDECVARVTKKEEEGDTSENCIEEFFHLYKCARNCAMPKAFAELK
ncbi:ubiquinol-cytochrome-c reductase complex subunit 8 [Schizosaccharomyces japonicus yFS275]|uniref:Ubiquinol-cytochrome-c reductase complex subunit 8 n=1 Tax=Schizosaccharomyces japonicus (strain yFS275 / FY16936) TaxID=402676 RepID=B6JY31_SCHJY|nr:ubiquinol-cytochrome-c reductase complex subunit 8 [Schizosaccharomyces japonicus yFS275]EEB06449.1 ubiquinol-cytochrome-c reductase complex subunit 8 [Schizosaccharomyces japonicus yFS275]